MKKEIRDKIGELEAEETEGLRKLEKLILDGADTRRIKWQRKIIVEIKARIKDLWEMS